MEFTKNSEVSRVNSGLGLSASSREWFSKFFLFVHHTNSLQVSVHVLRAFFHFAVEAFYPFEMDGAYYAYMGM